MKNNPETRLKYYLELSKLKIMLPVTLTGFTGYFIFEPHISVKLLLVSLGILSLAISASVLNQIQEVKTDGKMNRTKDRPLPARKIKVKHAIYFFFCLFIAGTALIYTWGNLSASLIGLFTIAWYNGVYTYSKKITAFAVIPGAITGALPPLIGWVAAGGGLWDKPIIFVEFLLFTGQIPHFWLLIMKYGQEYKNAGFPTITDLLSNTRIKRLTFIWTITSVIAALYLCYFNIFQTGPINGILLLASALLVWQFINLVKNGAGKISYKRLSILLDSYFFLVLLLLISDRVIS